MRPPGLGGNLGGIAGADAACQAEAAAAGLRGTFLAWPSDSTGTSPSTRFSHPDTPYVRADGVQVAPSWAYLIGGGNLDATLAVTAAGSPFSGSSYTNTGTQPDGTADPAGRFCDDWTTNSSSVKRLTGLTFASDSPRWTMSNDWTCVNNFALRCFQQ
jgi:hypothetical protein